MGCHIENNTGIDRFQDCCKNWTLNPGFCYDGHLKGVALDQWVNGWMIMWVEVVNITAEYVWIDERMGRWVGNKLMD